MRRLKIKTATDQRPFVMVYHDFLDSNLLTCHEKMVFIALKKFANSKNQCYPSLKRLSSVTGLSKRKIQDLLKALENKHVIVIESRLRADGGTASNIYTLYDYAEIWKTENDGEIVSITEKIIEEQLIEELKARGYTVTKKKASTSATDQSTDIDTFHNQDFKLKNNMKKQERQETYSAEFLKERFKYEILQHDHPEFLKEIDYIFQILYDTLNTDRETIRVQKTERPRNVVTAQLLKLTYEEIVYVIGKYNMQTDRISHPKAYILTQLYEAVGQYNADMRNQVNYDMSNF